MGGFLRKLIKRPDVKKVLKEVAVPEKEKVKEEKKDTSSDVKRKGRRSTIKTSSSGLNDAEIKKKTLLG
tara:strand:- start:172 stop:378 length:207 start_codon:yes stop_codon:yes gene_type:complete